MPYRDIEQRRAKQAEYRAKNRALLADKSRAHYKENRSARCATVRRYRENNLAQAKTVQANRKARVRGAPGKHTAAEWRAVLAYSGGRCYACGSKENIHRDHIVPLALGGSNSIDNIQPLCAECNLTKGTKHIDYRRRSDWLWI